MKIKSISIYGFRGFNQEQSLLFHDELTLLYAPNSYGKTSISEALEWLLYGVTSKVQRAESIEEYKGSYRNKHLPNNVSPCVEVTFIKDSRDITFKAELLNGENVKRFQDGREVSEWSFGNILDINPKPFILQHALKDLLLAKPVDRFQRFAQLLGLDEVDQIYGDLIKLCTKPEARLHPSVDQLRKEISSLETRLSSQASLSPITKNLKKGFNALSETYNLILKESIRRAPSGTKEESILPQLLKIREDAVGKIFRGRIILNDFTESEKQANIEDERYFIAFITDQFLNKYLELTKLAAAQFIIDQAKFFEFGLNSIKSLPAKCPFCEKTIDVSLHSQIHKHYEQIKSESAHFDILREQRIQIVKSLESFKRRIQAFYERHISKIRTFLQAQTSLNQLETILREKHPSHLDIISVSLDKISNSQKQFDQYLSYTTNALDEIQFSVENSTEDVSLLKNFGTFLTSYITNAQDLQKALSTFAPSVSEADQVLKHKLDTLAGTQDISLLIELIENRKKIERKFQIDNILDNLKELRKTIDQVVATKMLNAISSELTSEVMTWYSYIKTSGDPDVHFGGFDMDRTVKGDLKARRVQIKATSYGKDLVSAVSSLSESKLNALGLCVSIATNLKSSSPFSFILFDDPIQSWDAAHENRFIEVIRKLVTYGKQIIILSHNKQWLDQVRSGCRSHNGLYYEITSYTQLGPHIQEVHWEKWTERLNEVDAILNDPLASNIKLQQAEAEIRLSITQLTSDIFFRKKSKRINASTLNSSKTRKMLIECGVSQNLVDRLIQTFVTTDDAHHESKNYVAQRERIRQYHSWVHELGSQLKG